MNIDFENEESLREYIDTELKSRYQEKMSEWFVEYLPDSMLGLFCVVLDGTHFVTRESVQAELKEMKIVVADEVIDKQLAQWRSRPLPPVHGILNICPK